MKKKHVANVRGATTAWGSRAGAGGQPCPSIAGRKGTGLRGVGMCEAKGARSWEPLLPCFCSGKHGSITVQGRCAWEMKARQCPGVKWFSRQWAASVQVLAQARGSAT